MAELEIGYDRRTLTLKLGLKTLNLLNDEKVEVEIEMKLTI